jgi:hypothetical protein
MPKSSPQKLKYQAEYNKRPEQKEAGVERRKARRHAIAEGKVAIGDGKDLSHKVPISEGGSSDKKNLKVQSEKANRDWRKGRSGYDVGRDK